VKLPIFVSSRFGLLSVAMLVVAGVACGSKKDTATPLATPSFSSNKTSVALQSPVEFTYRFEVAPGAKFNGDYHVFVHVVRDDGRLMWTDDHEPPVPTSQWKPGQKIEYTRARFIPPYPYLGEATVQMGLYKGDERLPLAGEDANRRAYKVGTLQIRPESDNVLLIQKTGWYQLEFAADPSTSWQWMQKTGVLDFKNPKRDVTFYLETDGRADLFDKPQEVTVWSGAEKIQTFIANNKLPVLHRMAITAAQLGTGEMTEIRVEVDRTFVPALFPAAGARDTRELGLRVYHAFVELK
jgi:hypothetical protein